MDRHPGQQQQPRHLDTVTSTLQQLRQMQQQQQQQQLHRRDKQQRSTKHAINPGMPRRTVTHHTSQSAESSIDEDITDTEDEIHLGRRATASHRTDRTAYQQRRQATDRPTVADTQDHLKLITKTGSSRGTRKVDFRPTPTEDPSVQSMQLSSFPVPQHLHRNSQPTSSQPLRYEHVHITHSGVKSGRPTKEIRETLPLSRTTTQSNTRSLVGKPGHISRDQHPGMDTSSDSEGVELATAVRTARRESITSSFARLETRASSSPGQEPLPPIQSAAPSARQHGQAGVHGSDHTYTALEKQYRSLMSSFTEKQRLTRQALVLGTQLKNDRLATNDIPPKTFTTLRRKENTGGDDNRDTLSVDPQIDLAGSASPTSTSSYSDSDGSTGTHQMENTSGERSVDPSRKRASNIADQSTEYLQSSDKRTTPSRLSQLSFDLAQGNLDHVAVLPLKRSLRDQDTVATHFSEEGVNKEQPYDYIHGNTSRHLDQSDTHHTEGKGTTHGVLTKKHTRRQMSQAKESSQSDVPIQLSWSTRQGHFRHKKLRARLEAGSGSDTSSDSEYRGTDKRHISRQSSPTTGGSLTAPHTVQRARRRKSIWTKSIMWVLRMFLWLAFLVTVQIVVMGLLFRPTSNKNLDKGQPQKAGAISYKGRDYWADHPGYMTYLEDGFGTETLAFCHDLLEVSNDQQRQPRVARSLQNRVLGNVNQAYDVSLEVASALASGVGRWLNSKWAKLWEQDDPLDWLAH